ncbi:HAD-superfamily subfamily IIA hydrolase [Xylaria sp. CBS 124048]|nr:HAD-superfamily subfamily IIA hydrolase [Xylaria sp. CBS 124048]
MRSLSISRPLGSIIRSHSHLHSLSQQARTFAALSHKKRAKTGTTSIGGSLGPGYHGQFVLARSLTIDGKNLDSTSRTAPPFAFAFDIDGVLLHVAKPIPGATETLKYLQHHNIPFILLTNGGGKHEHDRVQDLSERLGVPLSTDNFVQSHTPFRELVDTAWGEHPDGLGEKNILVTGSNPEKSRLIAETYGFKSVITPADILAAHPTVFPFETMLKSHYAATARPLPSPNPKVDAIFVYNDPRDWALDTQIILDLLLSEGGVLGTYSPKNGRAEHENYGWQTDGQSALYFSNRDLFWSATYHLPRFGQGAFQAALAGIWRQITAGKAEMRRTTIGKPYARTYEYAERVLGHWRTALLKRSGDGSADPAVEARPLSRVYMVGDNPESDIRGANEFASPRGTQWSSLLVRTGVWSKERDGEPRHKPTAIANDVKEAVEWALEREGWR